MTVVRTKSQVEIRTTTPFRKADNLKGVLYPGFNIEVAESITGEEIAGNKIWYKDLSGNYYWSGGFEEDSGSPGSPDILKALLQKDFISFIKSSFDAKSKNIINDVNYNALLDIPAGIKLTKGAGIKIGVMDHPIIQNNTLFSNPVVNVWNGEKIYDKHGTFIAGLIAGYRSEKNIFEGVSSQSNLISLPLYINGFHVEGRDLIKNLKSFSEKYKNDRLVINISQRWNNPEQELIDFFEEFSEKHLLVASAGEDAELSEDKSVQWPASLDKVIAVGSVSKEFFASVPDLIISRKVDIIVPNFDFVSFTIQTKAPFSEASGDSCAAAITTGLIALLISGYEKEKINKENILSDLLKHNVQRKITADSFNKLNLIIPEK